MKLKNEGFGTFKQKMLAGRPGLRAAYSKSQVKHELICKMIDARISEGMTQAQLARKVGTKQGAISRFESGAANPTYDFLSKLASALGRKLSIDLTVAT